MMMRSIRKPPLARSPVRTRVVQSTPSRIQTPPGCLTKSELLKKVGNTIEEWEVRPEYRTISSELRALANMVQQELGNGDTNAAENCDSVNAKRSPLFERGRFYEEYSSRRNEMLKRKKGVSDTEDEKKQVHGLGVRVESSKKRGEPKKYQSARKAIPCTPLPEKTRYNLRSTASKGIKKPPLSMSFDKSERKTGLGRARKI